MYSKYSVQCEQWRFASSFVEFVLLCEIVHRVLNDVNFASMLLQRHDIDLGRAYKAIGDTNDKIKMYRNDFESFKSKARETAKRFNIDPHFQNKRQTKVKKHFDELASDHRFETREEIFRVSIFNKLFIRHNNLPVRNTF